MRNFSFLQFFCNLLVEWKNKEGIQNFWNSFTIKNSYTIYQSVINLLKQEIRPFNWVSIPNTLWHVNETCKIKLKLGKHNIKLSKNFKSYYFFDMYCTMSYLYEMAVHCVFVFLKYTHTTHVIHLFCDIGQVFRKTNFEPLICSLPYVSVTSVDEREMKNI